MPNLQHGAFLNAQPRVADRQRGALRCRRPEDVRAGGAAAIVAGAANISKQALRDVEGPGTAGRRNLRHQARILVEPRHPESMNSWLNHYLLKLRIQGKTRPLTPLPTGFSRRL